MSKDKQTGFNKSGYELRADLLGMAIGILESRRQALFENEHLKPDHERKPVQSYETKDVIHEATTLYEFVKETDRN